ncbi:EsaB/YukD family protein [Nocardioides sp.]|uniref:EsaB/YukD family protein n=1 Tax=Nocardioides sp. TaxID=35761 RepID=UPI003D0CCE3E
MTVAFGCRRADVVLPGGVPVAELVSELAPLLGVPESGSGLNACSLVSLTGHEFTSTDTLATQGVRDGSVLVLSPAPVGPAPRVYDDLVELVADMRPRAPEPARGQWSTYAGVGCLLVAALCMVLERGTTAPGAALAGLAALLLTVAVVSSHRGDGLWSVGSLGWAAATCGVASTVSMVPDGPSTGTRFLAGGAAAAIVGLVGLIAMGPARLALLPVVLAGGVLAIDGWVLARVSCEAALVLLPTVCAAGITAGWFPAMSLSFASIRPVALSPPVEGNSPVLPLDDQAVRSAIRLADHVLIALTTSSAMLVVVVAPFAVGSGLAGTSLLAVISLLSAMRSRGKPMSGVTTAELCSGIAGGGALMTSIVLHQPAWRPGLAAGVVVLGSVLVGAGLFPGKRSGRRAHMADLIESALQVSLLPLLVLGMGLLAGVRG